MTGTSRGLQEGVYGGFGGGLGGLEGDLDVGRGLPVKLRSVKVQVSSGSV